MALKLGKSFDRRYDIRTKFLNGYYDISLFFNTKSTFLLFSLDQGVRVSEDRSIKINMFKNLISSKFCETFIELHNFRKNTLDILNQFKCIRPEYEHEISFVFNETLTLSKVEVHDRIFYDCLNIYGFTLNSFVNEFIFILTERQNISTSLGKKIVRTSGLQIATSQSLATLDEFHQDSLTAGRAGTEILFPDKEIIKLDEVD